MGICCCRAESPCSSAEERSGLLSDDGKAAAPAGEKHGGGTCGPDGDDCKRKTSGDTSIKVEVKTETVQVKQSLEAEPNNTQENGPLLKGDIQTSTPSPKRESELQENSTRAQHVDMKDCPADSHQADLLTCTLDTAQEVHAAAECQGPGEQENPASVQDKTFVDGSVMTNEVYPEILTQADAAAEHISLSAAHDNSEEEEEAGAKVDSAVDEQSQQQMNEAPSGAAHQPALVPAVGEEVDKEALSCDVTKDLHCGSSSVVKEAEPEVVNSPDVSEITSGSEPLELNHSGEETGSEKHAPEPETTARTDPSESSTSNQDEKPAVEFADTSSTEVASLEVIKQDVTEEEAPEGQDEDEDAPTAEEEEDAEKKQEMVSVPMEGGDGERKVSVDEEKLTGSSPADVEGDEPRATEKKDAAENDLGNSEEDLYRGADELSAPPDNDPGSPSEPTFLKVEDRCSLAPAMDILSYSEREWKGNTAKSALIRKGYKDMSQRFSSLRRVRGDNYCALRATLFQVLTHSTQLPPWLQEQDVTMLPSRLEAQEGLISQWTFPGGCLQAEGTEDATLQLQGYMELLQNKWQAAVDCASAGERLQLCERLFGGGEEELALLEALKLLMLGRAAELHGRMQKSEDVPFFCWLLFARDTSDSLRSFLCNHLSHVGLSAGLEQVEMFLLGYALRCTIQVYRLYKADTEEFVTYYPDDHKDDWPSVCLVTEDDRHYNVPVEHAAEAQELDSS